MAAPPSGSGNVDKFYFKNSVAKDGKAKSMAKQLRKTTATIAQDIKTEVSLARQYEGALTLLTFCTAYICWLQFSDISCAPCGTVPRMEWGGVWASQYPSNDGTDGRVDLIRVDHKKDKAGNFRIIATKLTGKCQHELCTLQRAGNTGNTGIPSISHPIIYILSGQHLFIVCLIHRTAGREPIRSGRPGPAIAPGVW
jgi:hypothetical protein